MMDEIAPSYVYKETRINLDSAVPNSTVVVRLPSLSGSNWAGRTAQKRPFSTEIPPAEDENAFKAKHLATSSSIYHRQYHSFPKSFLWRILEDGRVLSIATVDLTKQEKAPDSLLILRLSFPSPIRPQCVAFAECKEHDVINVFVLTESNHLFTLNLRPEFFRRRAATDDNAADWCKIYLSSAFSFKHPHRLVALKPTEVLITLHDGGLLKLDRLAAEDASAWKETFYNVGGWTHGLKSLIPFQGGNTIKYGKTNIEVAAATSIAVPAIDIEGFTYAFTVSLDHRIRVWNLGSGRITWTGDLIGIDKTPQELGKWVIHPSQSQLIRVLQDVDERTLVITYSPIGAGQFKFWNVSSDGDGAAGLVDMFPGTVFIPPPPTSDVWTLADFTTILNSSRRDTIQLWLLWKNNTTYRLQSIEVELSGMSVVDAWNSEWTAVAPETLLETPTPISLPSDPEDCTEKWLKYILYPGKFTSATIETSLAIYERGQGKSNHAALRTTKNLAERMCTIIGSEAKLSRTANDHVHYDGFKAETDAQWRRFYRLVLELDKQRGEALSLAFDPEHEMTWVVTADGLSAIRDCSEIERLYHNPETKYAGRFEAVSALVTAGSVFRETFSESLLQSCKTMLQVELFQDSSLPDSARLRTYYDRCNLDGQIGDDEYSQLIANLGGSFKDVRLDVYETLLETMTSSDDSDSRLERLPLATFGRKTVIKGVQETIELHRSICLDQLVLLAFIEGEVDQEQEEMELDTEIVFRRLLEILKRLELLDWLSKTQISIPIVKSERPNSVSVTDKNSLSPTKKREDTKTVTVLEGAISHLLGLVTHSGGSTASLLTELFIGLCDPESDYELQPALIQSFLLVMERADLAMEFSRFCDQHPFSVYIQGRACLAANDLSTAALYFKKAAYGLAHEIPKIMDKHSSGLLNSTDWVLFYSGLPSYYCHIISLFDLSKSHSYVIDFARLALQFFPGQKPSKAKDALRTDILSRLFSAAIITQRYDIAHSALFLIPDHAIQLSSLRTLVISMCEQSSAAQLLDLPFIGLQDEVDEILAQKCQSIQDVTMGVPFHKILYAWRIRHSDFRGAASVSLERLQRLQASSAGNNIPSRDLDDGEDELETPVTKQYLTLINALSCVDPKQAWVLTEPVTKKNGMVEKRKVVTLEDARRGYQDELDRIERVQRGRFAFIGGEEVEMGGV